MKNKMCEVIFPVENVEFFLLFISHKETLFHWEKQYL